MKQKIFFLIALFSFSAISSQVSKKVVVEHFTNTKCSICASKNPGFYTNLWNHPEILHVTYHPSSPYSDCYLNNLNPTENDDRTNYYGVYGGTPRFVIQGEVVASSTNLNNASLFTPYTGQMSEASIKISHEKFSSDSIQVRVVITTEASHSYGNLRLFVSLVEDTVAYNAPNGEDHHYDVFRKSLSKIEGDGITLPANVSDSIVLTFSNAFDPIWNYKRIYAMAILQEEGSKEVVQTNVTSSDATGSPIGINELHNSNLEIYPNPANDILRIKSSARILSINLYDLQGKNVYSNQNVNDKNKMLDVTSIFPGVYFLSVLTEEGLVNKKVLIE